MRVGVDLDDVLSDLISELICTHRVLTGACLTREQATGWSVFPAEVHDRVRAEGYGRLTVLPGAREFMEWLRPRHGVFIVTYRNEAARAVTRQWLDTHFTGLYDDVRFTGGSKVNACRELRLDLLIDDSCHQLPDVTRCLGIPGILMDTPMNRHLADNDLMRRAHNLAEARSLVEHWERQAGRGVAGLPAARGATGEVSGEP